MKTVNIFDLRHYERAKPPAQHSDAGLATFNALQPTTSYGHAATVIAGLLLRKLISTVPAGLYVSPQPRAMHTLAIIKMTNGWTDISRPLDVLNDLRSDPAYDVNKLSADHAKYGGGFSLEHTAITRDWSCRYLFDRSTAAFADLGSLIKRLNDYPDGSDVLMVSHGGAIEIRCIRMIKLAYERIPLAKQTWQNIDLAHLNGGVFNTNEGGIYRNVQMDESGVIVGCEAVEQFRLPFVVTDLRTILK